MPHVDSLDGGGVQPARDGRLRNDCDEQPDAVESAESFDAIGDHQVQASCLRRLRVKASAIALSNLGLTQPDGVGAMSNWIAERGSALPTGVGHGMRRSRARWNHHAEEASAGGSFDPHAVEVHDGREVVDQGLSQAALLLLRCSRQGPARCARRYAIDVLDADEQKPSTVVGERCNVFGELLLGQPRRSRPLGRRIQGPLEVEDL